jgi:nitrate reductase gamma subunit
MYALEITGFALGVWALAGLLILIYRRASNAKVRAVTTGMDWVVLALLLVQIASGLWIAAAYRFGSSWAPSLLVPYVRSLILLQPRPELVAYVPLGLKLHVCAFFALAAVFPFSRLLHILPVPLPYLWRPWQLVIETRPTASANSSCLRGADEHH